MTMIKATEDELKTRKPICNDRDRHKHSVTGQNFTSVPYCYKVSNARDPYGRNCNRRKAEWLDYLARSLE